MPVANTCAYLPPHDRQHANESRGFDADCNPLWIQEITWSYQQVGNFFYHQFCRKRGNPYWTRKGWKWNYFQSVPIRIGGSQFNPLLCSTPITRRSQFSSEKKNTAIEKWSLYKNIPYFLIYYQKTINLNFNLESSMLWVVSR